MVRFGGCGRFLWNALLAEQNEEYREYMEEIESRLMSKTSRFEIDFDRWNVIAGASAANEVCDPGNSAS